jgi:CTP:molybdopterin cytidylyltransferase MocA
MGSPKELLEFQGVTCLEKVLAACAGACLSEPILVTRAERAALLTELLHRWQRPATVVVNPRPELGQTSSLRAGLAQLPPDADGFAIYPVDHPLVTAADVCRLGDTFEAAFAAAGTVSRPVLVAPSFAGRRGHPVFVDAQLGPAILALPETGSARDVLRPLSDRTRFVSFDDDRVLIDMDTPAAYEECQRRLAAAGPKDVP